MRASLAIQITVPAIKCLFQDLVEFRNWSLTDMALPGGIHMNRRTQINLSLPTYMLICGFVKTRNRYFNN